MNGMQRNVAQATATLISSPADSKIVLHLSTIFSWKPDFLRRCCASPLIEQESKNCERSKEQQKACKQDVGSCEQGSLCRQATRPHDVHK